MKHSTRKLLAAIGLTTLVIVTLDAFAADKVPPLGDHLIKLESKGTNFSRVLYLTNSPSDLRLISVLTTNWLALDIAEANGDGTTRQKPMEVGIVLSNRYARVYADGASNQVLLSSTPIATPSLLVRERKVTVITTTNSMNLWMMNVPGVIYN